MRYNVIKNLRFGMTRFFISNFEGAHPPVTDEGVNKVENSSKDFSNSDFKSEKLRLTVSAGHPLYCKKFIHPTDFYVNLYNDKKIISTSNVLSFYNFS